MDFGSQFRDAIENMMQIAGEPILIHKSWSTPQQITSEVTGMKNNEKDRPREVMFQFLEDPGIVVGDVLQQKGARDVWRVLDTQDEVISGTYVNFEAKVEKIGASVGNLKPHIQTVTIHGSVHGALQVNSPQGVQQVGSNNISVTDQSVSALRWIIEASELSSLDKEEAGLALTRISELASRPKSPDLIAKMSEKVESVRKIVEGMAAVASSASPYLSAIHDWLSRSSS